MSPDQPDPPRSELSHTEPDLGAGAHEALEWFPAGSFPADRARLLDIAQARQAPPRVLDLVMALVPGTTWDGPEQLGSDLARSTRTADHMRTQHASHETEPRSGDDTEWARKVADDIYDDPLVADGDQVADEEDRDR